MHQPLTRTSLADGLLHQWQRRNLAASLPLALRQLEDAGNLDNIRLAIQAEREGVIALLEEAQRPDGYLNSYFQVSGEPQYTRLAWSHEMYCAGHLIQAALQRIRGRRRHRGPALLLRQPAAAP